MAHPSSHLSLPTILLLMQNSPKPAAGPRLSPSSASSLPTSHPGPVRGDIVVYAGVGNASVIIEAYDLECVVQEKFELSLKRFTVGRVERYRAKWRRLMHGEPQLALVRDD